MFGGVGRWGGGVERATTNFCGVICYHVDGWVGCRREHMYICLDCGLMSR